MTWGFARDDPLRARVTLAVASLAAIGVLLVTVGPLVGPGSLLLLGTPIGLAAWLFGTRVGIVLAPITTAVALGLQVALFGAPASAALPEAIIMGGIGPSIGYASDLHARAVALARRLAASEACLRSSEAQLRIVTANSTDVVFLASADGSQLIYINPAYERITGLKEADLRQNAFAWLEQIDPEDAERVAAAMASVLTGRPAEAEYRIHRPDGSVRWVHTWATRVAWEGTPCVVGRSTDITERHLAADEARAAAARLERAQRIAHVGDWELDLATRAFLWSDEAFRLVRREPRSFQPTFEWVMEHTLPEDRAGLEAAFHATASRGFGASEGRLRLDDGAVRVYRTQMEATRNAAGVPTMIHGVVTDVTDALAAQAEHGEALRRSVEGHHAEKTADFKARLLNSAAHELATPLTPVLLDVASLRSAAAGALPPEHVEAVRRLDRSVARLAAAVREVVEAARVGALPDLPREETDLAALLRETAERRRPAATEAGVTVVVRDAPAIRVSGDERLLRRALASLVESAIAMTPVRGVVELRAARRSREALAGVTDGGPGLTESDLAALSEPLGRPTETEGVHGYYLARAIAERHGGRLEAASAGRGRGSTITLVLPAAEVTPPASG